MDARNKSEHDGEHDGVSGGEGREYVTKGADRMRAEEGCSLSGECVWQMPGIGLRAERL